MKIRKYYRKLLRKYKILHYLGLHDRNCRRRLYTTKEKYLCIRTGKSFKV